MNIVFWILIAIAAAALWYGMSGLFYKIGDKVEEEKENIFNDEEYK